MKQTQPLLTVGILSGTTLHFRFLSVYVCDGKEVCGVQTASLSAGKILWNGRLYPALSFSPVAEEGCFELPAVTIGIGFHWERTENQCFYGALKLIVEADRLTLVNIIPVEKYLESVISSEMNASAPLELLKAHAVISRSWILAQQQRKVPTKSVEGCKSNGICEEKASGGPEKKVSGSHEKETPEEEHLRWYDSEGHTQYDVCADDHCQRYQGITRAAFPIVRQAVEETRGQILAYNGELCDARFSKCCGGVMEEFRFCWEDKEVPYLQSYRDDGSSHFRMDLRNEKEAENWIRSTPEAFCHTRDREILSRVLNIYDRETSDFYRWRVVYSQDELSALVNRRSGIDFGTVEDLQPVERGRSGRLVKLRIVGGKRSAVIGKELEIRRTLSPSHLYSSAFVADKKDGNFILTGAGWGHGVGLCQIGAAVMASQGYDYRSILLHYYIGAQIENYMNIR